MQYIPFPKYFKGAYKCSLVIQSDNLCHIQGDSYLQVCHGGDIVSIRCIQNGT